MAAFWNYIKNVPEVQSKAFGVMPLIEGIKRQPSFDTDLKLLVINVMHINNEKQHDKQS